MTDQFVIERNVPVDGGRGRKHVYPFGQMEVGDSFFVPSESKSRNTVTSYASRFGKRKNIKFTSRRETDGFWRIKIPQSCMCTIKVPARPAVYDCPSIFTPEEEAEMEQA